MRLDIISGHPVAESTGAGRPRDWAAEPSFRGRSATATANQLVDRLVDCLRVLTFAGPFYRDRFRSRLSSELLHHSVFRSRKAVGSETATAEVDRLILELEKAVKDARFKDPFDRETIKARIKDVGELVR